MTRPHDNPLAPQATSGSQPSNSRVPATFNESGPEGCVSRQFLDELIDTAAAEPSAASRLLNHQRKDTPCQQP